MRLFKKQASETCPQLVSATPISQDEATEAATNRASEEKEKCQIVDKKGSSRRLDKESECEESEKIPTTQSFMITRKGISTWGRKVGRRLDQLKRSESSELLSVSGRRRRWSPNRKRYENGPDEKENGSSENTSPVLPKPKRVSRVESLKNLFRSTERSNFLSSSMSSRNVTIQEEVHYPMEKALSEGAIKSIPFQVKSEDNEERQRGTLLQEKQRQLSRSIHNLQEQERIVDFILMNQQVLKTREGTALAKETLSKIEKGNPPRSSDTSDCSTSRASKSNVSPKTRTLSKLENANKSLFASSSDQDSFRNEQQRSCPLTGLEDLMSNLRLGCDESGYDSDSTRAGADSPDSEQCVPRMTKSRSFSITSDDYHGIDLSLPPIIVPPEPPKTIAGVEDVDNTMTESRNYLNESVTTETTLIISENDDDTDSCDEDTFDDFEQYTKLDYFADNSRNETVLESSQFSKSITKENRDDLPTRQKNVEPVSQARTTQNLSNPWTQTKSSTGTLKTRKYGSASVMNLLENAASPCKDSPPATKIQSLACSTKNPVHYYSPKRSRAVLEAETSPDETLKRINKVKRTVLVDKATPRSTPNSTPAKSTLIRRELKTMKLTVERSANLGISVERQEAVRPFYVISKLDPNGEAAKSKLFRIGDEIVRVCGRRLRGMSLVEARSALRSCVGNVELQIAREPTFAFGEEIGDTWAELDRVPSTRSDSDVWTLRESQSIESTVSSTESKSQSSISDLSSKEKVEAPLKRPKSDLSMESTRNDDADRKVTGMRKFQVIKKRTSHPVCYPRKVTSLSKDLLTVTLEKGSTKKLGFSIVGGSDSKKGYMGIFVKDIMEGGQAAEEGTLRVGDEILAINGIPMDGATHTKALQTFKNAKAGKMILCIGRRDPTNKRLCYKR